MCVLCVCVCCVVRVHTFAQSPGALSSAVPWHCAAHAQPSAWVQGFFLNAKSHVFFCAYIIFQHKKDSVLKKDSALKKDFYVIIMYVSNCTGRGWGYKECYCTKPTHERQCLYFAQVGYSATLARAHVHNFIQQGSLGFGTDPICTQWPSFLVAWCMR